MAGNEKIWGPRPAHSEPVKHPPGKAVGEDSLGGAVGELHRQHPHHVQGENLQGCGEGKMHHPVGHVYKGS